MEIAITDLSAQLAELIRRANAGDEIVITDKGNAIARLVPVREAQTPAERLELIESIMAAGRAKAKPGFDPAHNHDFLYDENGPSA